MLKFLVQGSGKLPYEVKFEGNGPELRSYCTCPAFRKGGAFCKHAAALLVGDVSNLVDNGTDTSALKEISAGSPLVEMALSHQPAKTAPTSIFNTLRDAEASLRVMAVRKNLWVEAITPDDFDPDQFGLSFHTIGKRGKPLKAPIASICFCTVRQEERLVVSESGEYVLEITIVPRTRPWVVMTEGSTRSYSTCERALPSIEEWLKSNGV